MSADAAGWGFARFARSRFALAAACLFALIAAAAALAPLLAPQDPYDLMQLDITDGRLPPGTEGGGGFRYWLGTDEQGRDILSGILYGLRISLVVGAGSAVIAGVIGTVLGLLAAERGGWTERAIMRLVDLQLSFPAILVALMMLAFIGRGIGNVMLALVLVEWAYYARTVHSAAVVIRERDYMRAARCLRLPRWRILLRHLLPNCLSPLLIVGTQQVARAIALEATLSFLGLGVPITEPSLGRLVANGYQYVLAGQYWISFYPGVALLLAIASINVIGDRLRAMFDPRRG